MKRSIILICLMAIGQLVFAQHSREKIWDTNIPRSDIRESVESMSLGDNNAIVMVINDMKKKSVSRALISVLKEYKTKPKTSRQGEIFAEGAYLPGNERSVDIYAYVEQTGEQSKVVTFFKMDDHYIRSDKDPKTYEAAWSLLRELDLRIAKSKVEDDLAEQEKSLKKFNKDFEQLEKELIEMINLVEKKKQEIVQLEKNQVINKEDQRRVEREIDKQREVVRRVEDELKKYKW